MHAPKLSLDGLKGFVSHLIEQFERTAAVPSEQIWHGRALVYFSALLPILAWPKAEMEIADSDLLNLDDLMRLANSSCLMISFAGGLLRNYLGSAPGVQCSSDGQFSYRDELRFCAQQHHGFLAMEWVYFANTSHAQEKDHDANS